MYVSVCVYVNRLYVNISACISIHKKLCTYMSVKVCMYTTYVYVHKCYKVMTCVLLSYMCIYTYKIVGNDVSLLNMLMTHNIIFKCVNYILFKEQTYQLNIFPFVFSFNCLHELFNKWCKFFIWVIQVAHKIFNRSYILSRKHIR